MGKQWLAGVTHAHTTRSDGNLTLTQLIEKAQKNKLDFLIITDHNKNCAEALPEVEGLTLIYGTELTKHGGHANFWGVKEAIDDFSCETYEEFLKIAEEGHRRGALVSMNHPLCTLCPWRWDKDVTPIDAVEIWNGPMHYDNLTCTQWWHDQLVAGHKVPVVGGSDYHRDYTVTNLLPNPVTYVLCDDRSPENILKNIKEGHTAICAGVGKTRVTVTSGKSVVGDTVLLKDDTLVTAWVSGLKKGHELVIYDKTGEIYRYKSVKTEDYAKTLPVKEPGFVRAEVIHTLNPVYKAGYNLYTGKRIPQQKGIELPPFIYAQCGAIYFE